MRFPIVPLACLAVACTANPTSRVPAYLTSDTCQAHVDESACLADDACHWTALGIPCRDGEPCRSGVCSQKDPCAGHGDEASCSADTADDCAWVHVAALCPAGATCPGEDGFCAHRPDGGCACACPLYCLASGDCPPCECDCPGGGGQPPGGTCTCECPECGPGEACPPCACDCPPPPPGCTGGATCTCACPVCAPNESCPPCDCDCPTADPAMGCACTCQACPPGGPCPPCDCTCGAQPPPATPVPTVCAVHPDEKTCVDDTEHGCRWAAILAPCPQGLPCPAGACYSPSGDGCPVPLPVPVPQPQ